MPRKNPAPPPEKTAASNRKRRGQTPDHGIDDLEHNTKRQRTAPSKPKKVVPADLAPSKSKKVVPADLPRVVPTANAKFPSPHLTELSDAGVELNAKLGMLPKDFVFFTWELQRSMVPPNWADDRVGKAFARWFCPGIASATGPTMDDSTTPIVSEAWIQDHGFISWEDLGLVRMPRTAKVADRKKANAPGARSVVEVFRENDEQGVPQFFLRWEIPTAVKVNGDACTHASGNGNFVIGPLPDYAIIEIGNAIIFWWKNASGLTYMPKDLAETIKQLPTNIEAEAAAGDKTRRDQWGKILKAGLKTSSTRQSRAHGEQPSVHGIDVSDDWQTIRATRDLADSHVFLATASVWRGLRNDGWGFAFGGNSQQQQIRMYPTSTEFFDTCRSAGVKAVVGGPDDLILPLVYNADHESPPSSATEAQFPQGAHEEPPQPAETETAKGKEKEPGKERKKSAPRNLVGHTLFAAAHRRADGTIETRVMDSASGSAIKDPHDTVQKLVKRSGWLAHDADGYPEIPPMTLRFERVDVPVPRQGMGQNSCGIHTILNAWRYMMGLPAVNQTVRLHQPDVRSRDYRVLDEAFINDALELINLAIAGHVDLGTIQAFMNYHGFCQLQDLDQRDLSTRPIPRINAEILGNELGCDQHDIGQERDDDNERMLRHVLSLHERIYRAESVRDARLFSVILESACEDLASQVPRR
ncbi:MAG: hypothetical protein LQ352_003553 [Teloschistes flavicans]|nr:MAG: hypothetical protein LQ352_003553 [Teloschistes flavicans]